MKKVLPAALKALEDPGCRQLFGEGSKDPADVLSKLAANVKYVEAGTKYVAEVRMGRLLINTSVDASATLWNTEWWGQDNYDIVTLLHEVGHATSSNPGNQISGADTSILGRSDPQKSWDNDTLIYENCLHTNNPFKRP